MGLIDNMLKHNNTITDELQKVKPTKPRKKNLPSLQKSQGFENFDYVAPKNNQGTVKPNYVA